MKPAPSADRSLPDGKPAAPAGRAGRLLWLLAAALLLAGPGQSVLRAQDTEADNPTGPSGDFNGEVTTGGSYDPLTGNAKRRVTDLTVPGANGAYPLAFARTYNSNVFYTSAGNNSGLGDSGNWRHSYQWALSLTYANGTATMTACAVAYPDGAVTNFRPGRTGAPATEFATYWRGPGGTADRLEVQSSSAIYLHTADGGLVSFINGLATFITDPNGAVTKLDYTPNYPNYLLQVTEPGGRWLQFHYKTIKQKYPNQSGGPQTLASTWTVLDYVQAGTAQAGNLQTVTYSYQMTQTQHQVGSNEAYGEPYQVLSSVSYDQETLAPDASGNVPAGNVHASYTYLDDRFDQPTLQTATDPHYAGAMVNIRYAAPGTAGTLEEENLGTSERVSRLDPGSASGGTGISSTETRGDTSSGTGNTSGAGANLTRTFRFGQASSSLPALPARPGGGAVPGSPKPSALTSLSDFEAYTSYKFYYDVNAKDAEGNGYLAATLDAAGHATYYDHEPLTGKTTAVVRPDGRTSTAVWASVNGDPRLPYLLQSTTDARGFTTTYRRDPNQGGMVYQLDHPQGGGSEYFSYQPFSGPNGSTFYKVSVHTNPLGGQAIYGYDETDENHGGSGHAGLLTSVTRGYAVGNAPVYERTKLYYDALDRVIKSVDPLNVTTLYGYNARHQLTQLTHAADGTSILYGYDDCGNRVTATDELGHTATTAYDEYRRVTSVTVPVNAPQVGGAQLASRYQAFAYDRRDNQDRPVGSATSHTGSNWSASWLPSGSAVQRIYSPNGWPTDEYRGMIATLDGFGVKPVPGNGAVHTSAAYNAIGQPVLTVDAQSFATSYAYDNCNRLAATNDQMGHATTRVYYGNGEPSSSANNRVNCTGLLKSVYGPGTDLLYQPVILTQYSNYDALGRLTETVDPFSHVFGSAFDAAGDLVGQSDGAQATGYGYDQLGRKTSLTYPPGGGGESWTYDAGGNLKTHTNRANAVCTYQYDGRNRCSRYDWSDGITSPTGYAYDAASRVIEVANWSADVLLAYDDSGALKKETSQLSGQSASLPTTYSHDGDGNVDSITYPNGNYPCYSYDSQQRCTAMYSNGVTYSAYGYDRDWLTYRGLHHGFSTTYGHQINGRVNDVWHHNGNGANVSRRGYGYAPDGQVSWFDRELDTQNPNIPASGSSLENGRGDAFLYWPDGSLGYHCRDMAVAGGWPQAFSATADSRISNGSDRYPGGTADAGANSYQYDQAGNRTQTQRSDASGNWQPALTYTADSTNRYTSLLGYGDGNGNTTQDYRTGWNYQYDAENKLTGATGPGGQSLDLQYDGLGRLVRQGAGAGGGAPTVKTLFYYAGSQRIEERTGAGAVRYLYFFDAPGSDQLLWREGGGWGRLWYQSDLLGNTTHLSAESFDAHGNVNGGYVVEQYLYDAFGKPSVYDFQGNPIAGGSQFDNRYLFKSGGGYEWLAGPGLYYCRARCYLPEHGRWLQPDPIGQAGGLNLYGYCKNDPVNGIDPEGLEEPAAGSAPKQDVGLGGPADGIISTGPAPIGSNIPTTQYIARNDFGYAVLNSSPTSGTTVAYQSDPHVTSSPIGGYTAVYPKNGDVSGGQRIMGTFQGQDEAQRAADEGHAIAYYLTGGDNFFVTWGFNIYSALFTASNTDAAADVATNALNYAAANGQDPHVEAYSQGNFAVVAAMQDYGTHFNGYQAFASPVNVLMASSAAASTGTLFGQYTARGDIISIPALGPSLGQFLSAFPGLINGNAIQTHITSYPPFTRHP